MENLDDIIVLGKSFEDHLMNLGQVFRRLREDTTVKTFKTAEEVSIDQELDPELIHIVEWKKSKRPT